MISREECLQRAEECEGLVGKLPASQADAMIEAAAIWRRLATDEFMPRTKFEGEGSPSTQGNAVMDNGGTDQNPERKS